MHERVSLRRAQASPGSGVLGLRLPPLDEDGVPPLPRPWPIGHERDALAVADLAETGALVEAEAGVVLADDAGWMVQMSAASQALIGEADSKVALSLSIPSA